MQHRNIITYLTPYSIKTRVTEYSGIHFQYGIDESAECYEEIIFLGLYGSFHSKYKCIENDIDDIQLDIESKRQLLDFKAKRQ
jgi:hypothetical protein